MIHKRTIAIVAGGTAGHVFPAYTIAQILSNGNNIICFTDNRGEKFFNENINTVIDKPDMYQIQKVVLWIRNIKGNFLNKIWSLGLLGLSTLKALYFLYKQKVCMVIGFGGLTAFPVLYAARILKIPIIIHEQNAVIGKSNNFFLKDALLVATAYEDILGINEQYRDKVVCVGNPIRPVIFDIKRRRTKITPDIFIFVIGGSQGSGLFDSVIANAIAALPKNIQNNITIFQQVRYENHEIVKDIYNISNVKKHNISTFFSNAPQIIADSDLIISRAGASVLAEIEHCGIPAIIVPMSSAADNHQYHNAEKFAKKNSATIILEQDFTQENLLLLIENFLMNDTNQKLHYTNYNIAAQKFVIKINDFLFQGKN